MTDNSDLDHDMAYAEDDRAFRVHAPAPLTPPSRFRGIEPHPPSEERKRQVHRFIDDMREQLHRPRKHDNDRSES